MLTLAFHSSFITHRSSLALLVAIVSLFSCSSETLTDPDVVIASWTADGSSSSAEDFSSSTGLPLSSGISFSSSTQLSSGVILSSSIQGQSSAIISSSTLPSSSSVSSCPSETSTSFTDCRDQKVYSKVTILDQVWMSQNLNYDTLNTTGSWCNSNISANCATYGRLYNWTTASVACPSGWHLPSDAEWQTLEKALGMTTAQATISGTWRGTNQGTQLKASNPLWTLNTGTNASGFAALPGGYATPPTFFPLNIKAYFWTSTETGTTPYYRHVADNEARIVRYTNPKSYAFSVRCVKD